MANNNSSYEFQFGPNVSSADSTIATEQYFDWLNDFPWDPPWDAQLDSIMTDVTVPIEFQMDTDSGKYDTLLDKCQEIEYGMKENRQILDKLLVIVVHLESSMEKVSQKLDQQKKQFEDVQDLHPRTEHMENRLDNILQEVDSETTRLSAEIDDKIGKLKSWEERFRGAAENRTR